MTGKPWTVLEGIVREFDSALADEIASCCNPGVTGRPSKSVDNINKQPTPDGTSRSYTLNRLKRDAPELFEKVKAKELSANAAAIARKTEPIAPHGGDRTKEQGAVGTLTKRGQNNAQYLTARLKRDAPEIAGRLERGEFKSVRQAAIEVAGACRCGGKSLCTA